jgi:5-methylcytosine-specific restriction protein B
MARILELQPSSQERISPHKVENGVVCEWKLIEDSDGTPLVHLSTFGSKNRQADPKSSQSIQVDEATAHRLIEILSGAFAEARGGTPLPAPTHVVISKEDPPGRFPDADESLADATNLPIKWLQSAVDSLRDRPQLILYGPPGTGKTFVASHLASHLARRDNIRMVQFHPSYSYEDFFEGFRPTGAEGGQLQFELRAGPLRRISDAARNAPSENFVLLIDEVNRGNLSKIFGELYFLLEYRDRSIDLMYGTNDLAPFSLPRNVIIIGTMNSVDRSVAAVDAAMRRRFAFLALRPGEYPVSDSLRTWLSKRGLPGRIADIHDALNKRIEEEDYKLGPSYFMRDSLYRPGGLDQMWNTSIIPLIADYRHGASAIEVQLEFSLDNILTDAGISRTEMYESIASIAEPDGT